MVSLFFSLYIHNNFSACFLSALPRLFDNLCVCFEKAASNVAFDNFHALFCLVSSLHSGLFFPVFSVVPFFLVWIFSGGFTREFNHLCARFFSQDRGGIIFLHFSFELDGKDGFSKHFCPLNISLIYLSGKYFLEIS